MTDKATEPNNPADTLKKLYITLKQTQAKLASVESAAHEPIAIIGMGCRFPGGANNLQKYWDLLINQKDAIIDVPSNRWSASDWFDPDQNVPGKMFTVQGGFLDQPVDMFDAAFFNISPKEASGLDPQQRLLLEVSKETFENAGIAASNLKGSSCGVFLGMSSDDYALAHRHSGDHKVIDAYSITGTTFSTACGRISYFYGLEGPAMTVDTACSSALVALHLACKSLRSKESHLALAGGVNLMLSPESHICFSKLRAISPDGRCKSFSADANGYVRGEGCGLIVLKRLSDALADKNKILAVIRGSAVNQDGKSNGLTAPNGLAQVKVIESALKDAGLTPSDLSFIETHGTGTSLGDPIEAEAISTVFSPHFSKDKPLIIGSCKTNIGHLEPASGIAALIKVVLCMQHGKIPANLHFEKPSPLIPWEEIPVVVANKTIEWKAAEGGDETAAEKERVAGVNAFGFSGTNVHVILSDLPQSFAKQALAQSSQQKAKSDQEFPDRSHHILTISAKTKTAAETLKNDYIKFLEDINYKKFDEINKSSQSNSSEIQVSDICRTSNIARDHFQYRIAAVGKDIESLIKNLKAQSEQSNSRPTLAFLFTGQGSQYPGMGRSLFETQPVFRQTLQRCDEILKPIIGQSLIYLFYDENADQDILHQTRFTQPALFALEYSLYSLWQSFGIEPDFMMGHSVGEYSAACAAGLFSLEDGLKLISRRGELMQSLPSGGGMAAIMAEPEEVEKAIAKYADALSVAAFNGPKHTVISGREDALTEAIEPFKARGTKVVRLTVSHAFHSPLIEPILDAFEKTAASISFKEPKIRLISNVSGDVAKNEIMTPAYWRKHIRNPVRFLDSMTTLQREGVSIFVEIGPKPTLLGMGRTALPDLEGLWLPSLRVGQPDWDVVLTSLGKIYTNGFDVNWNGLYPSTSTTFGAGQPVELPNYPFERKRFWTPIPSSSGLKTGAGFDAASGIAFGSKFERLHPLIDRKIESPLLSSTLFETQFNQTALPFLDDHRIFEKIVVSAASHLSLLSGASGFLFSENKGCVIEDILFTQALIIPENKNRTLQVLFSPIEETEQHDFTIITFNQKEREHTQGKNRYIRHVTGRITPFNSEKQAASGSELNNLKSAWEDCKTVIDPDTVYSFQDQRQIKLGASYRWISQIQKGEGQAVCRFQSPDGVDMAAWGLHPGLIDSCFGLMVMASEGDPETTYIPFAIEEFRCYRKPDPTNIQAVARIRRASAVLDNSKDSDRSADSNKSNVLSNLEVLDKLVGDIKLYDKNGLVAEWIGLEGRQVDPESLFKDSLDSEFSEDSEEAIKNREVSEIKNWLYEIEWDIEKSNSLTTSIHTGAVSPTAIGEGAKKGGTVLKGEWIIISDTQALASKLSERLREKGDECRFWSWDNLAGDNEVSTLSGDRKLSALSNEGEILGDEIRTALKSESLKGVIHLVTSDCVDLAAELTQKEQPLELVQKNICGVTLELVQALVQRSGQSVADNDSQPRLILVTCKTQTVTGDEKSINPHAATLWGMGRVIALEHPELTPILVDRDSDSTIEEAAKELVTVCHSDKNGESQIAFRQGQLYLARLRRASDRLSKLESIHTNKTTQTEAAPIDMKDRQPKISSDATYLITGGLGGLGLATAGWLVENNAGCIVLVGRSKPSQSVLASIEELRNQTKELQNGTEEIINGKQNVRIEIRSVDLALPEQVGSLIAEIAENMPPLKGVIHAAGLLDDGMMRQLNWSKFWKVMSPKVMGAWTLDQLTRNLELDFFVCFSSIVSILGTPAQSNYAAANAFLDGICRKRGIESASSIIGKEGIIVGKEGIGEPVFRKTNISINWGPFDQVGMAANLDEINKKRITSQGFKLISPKSGLIALSNLLGQSQDISKHGAYGQDTAQIAVMSVDWSKFMERVQLSSGELFLSDFKIKKAAGLSSNKSIKSSWQDELIKAPNYEHQQLLLSKIQTATANILGMDSPDQVLPDARLFDLGLDSLMAVELKNLVEKNMNCRLKSTLVFDYPTVGSMTEYLLKTMVLPKPDLPELSSNISEKAAEQKPAAVTVEPQLKILSLDVAVEELSEDDAEEMLRQELANLLGND
ncbi:MAG: SDR family NAD(P)-dependent oxidoreductase [Desulfamplus sp.]|nr:SDR family NAD(P)-dependent oxidoreductase [Desulfamplus sp.]